jgi:DNA-binding response OmpR family regulator
MRLREEADVAVSSNAQTAHLLVVDDEPNSIELFVTYLREYDFAIDTATTGDEGLEKARRARPDLILLDVSMPPPNGFQVLQELQSFDSTRKIPVLLVSAFGDTTSKVRGFQLGASDYVTKPVDEAELHARVAAQLERSRLYAALESKLRAYQRRYGSEAVDTEKPEPARNDVTRQEIERLFRARQILRKHVANPPSLIDLAQMLGTNQPYLSRGFRALFGTTVFGFVRELRLQRARELLSETTTPVKSIALEVGYRNTSDLTRGIKERFGMSPTELRERA